ncbi:hypothetical protein [Janthinobacterium sp. SUN120]|uniref:hypothetical protein n=1 Tax=Janthinobacterium sp. SUN120 TaxID=3004099 RepID=UPI0025AF60A6|nr:hypothetical protein [Janthinobacterium sp. SUN120]MDN2716084.1 hypothetical protein [Janthinobacterium sp. SUN120]
MEFWLTILTSLGGSAVVAGGLATWLGNTWHTRIVAKEAAERELLLVKVQASLERANAENLAKLGAGLEHLVLIDRIRFEHEYEVYRTAWALLVPLRGAVLAIRPIYDEVDSRESEQARLERRLGAVTDPYNNFLRVVQENKPFYDKKVFDALTDVCTTCHVELIDAQGADSLGFAERWKKRASNEAAILAAIDASCDAIQLRIAEVRIV